MPESTVLLYNVNVRLENVYNICSAHVEFCDILIHLLSF